MTMQSIFGESTLYRDTDKRRMDRADRWFDTQCKAARHTSFGIEGELTPELAERLLANNASNRVLYQTDVDKIARDIENGAWSLNGETIIVSSNGYLNDGQHRCHAVKQAGRSVRTAFWFGVSRDSRLTVDVGRVRTTGDFLHMEDVPNSRVAASVAKNMIQFEARRELSTQPHRQPSKQEQLDYYNTHPELEHVISDTPKDVQKLGGRALLATAHYIFHRVDEAEASTFIRQLALGTELSADDPVYRLREYLLKIYSDGRGANKYVRLNNNAKLELIVRIWNRRRRKGKTKVSTKVPDLEGTIPKVD